MKPDKRFGKEKMQEISKKGIAFLLLFLMGCFLLARASDSLGTPVVTLSKVERKGFEHTVSMTGKLTAEGSLPIVAPANAVVTEVKVAAGDSVSAGDLLFRYDTKTFQQELSQKLLERKRMRTELGVLSYNRSLVTEKQDIERARVEEDYQNAVDKTALSVSAASRDLAEARDNLNGRTKESKPFGGTSAGLSLVDEENGEERDDSALRSDYRTKKGAYDSALLEQKEALLTARRAIEDAEKNEKDATIALLGIDIEMKNLEIKVLEETLANEGAVYADVGGIVTDMTVSLGKLTSSDAALCLAEEGGLLFQAEVSAKDMKYITKDSVVSLSLTGESQALQNLAIHSISPVVEKEDTYRVLVQIPKGVGVSGLGAEGKVNQKTAVYETCVPLSAVYGSGTDTYVFASVEGKSAMGSSFKVEKIPVTVLDKNDTIAAVQGAISTDTKVVKKSDKTISDGMKVRVEDEKS